MQNKEGNITSSIKNNPCPRCSAAGYPNCRCGGGGGGSGSGGDKSESKDTNVTNTSKTASTSNKVEAAIIQKFDEAKTIFVQSQLLNNKTINYEAGLFSIESDRLRGNLTIKVKPGLSKVEEEISREFLNTIKTEFDAFKNQLAEKGVSTSNFTATLKGNELSFHIPNPKYYDAFIKHLENKNLLPVPNPEKQEEKEFARQEKNRPSPFGDILKGPKPKGME